ncbi:hypothetical protein HRE53_20460 [Acaryochloris sp. 'Moss Beach']|uniref:hypothetical protein n=1 Tax=Acaryochloris TaxID=155977 RepID=UPI001BAFB545|nr:MULTISPECIES: hypothetical protein [Acaryochloris]QUY44059.1 hypothetical protein I1H34_08200 [Acaryochloris marina S15]UJB68805.1 hypothetical protein HRE53_20460 [Acaryochloris sp. 'Moss Beach']
MLHREYQYVGPAEIHDIARTQPAGTSILCADDLCHWLTSTATEKTQEGSWIATFTIGVNETLRLATRRSEHIACAAGGPVLSAGEITIDQNHEIATISNQSTGFCPEPESWWVVESVLNRIGIKHPGRFTDVIVFRLCPNCNACNIVKDAWFYCQLCDAKLPERWNFPLIENKR